MSEFRIHLRVDIHTNWLLVDPVPGLAEPVWTSDLLQLRMGDGIHAYSELPIIAEGSDAFEVLNLAQHVNDPTPHPAYDDMSDPVLFLENGMV